MSPMSMQLSCLQPLQHQEVAAAVQAVMDAVCDTYAANPTLGDVVLACIMQLLERRLRRLT